MKKAQPSAIDRRAIGVALARVLVADLRKAPAPKKATGKTLALVSSKR